MSLPEKVNNEMALYHANPLESNVSEISKLPLETYIPMLLQGQINLMRLKKFQRAHRVEIITRFSEMMENLALAVGDDRLNNTQLQMMILDEAVNEYGLVWTEVDLINAMERGMRGLYGKVYKITTMAVFDWFRQYEESRMEACRSFNTKHRFQRMSINDNVRSSETQSLRSHLKKFK